MHGQVSRASYLGRKQVIIFRLIIKKKPKKRKEEEKNEALFIHPLYSAGRNSHSFQTHCPAATQANLISTKSSPSLAFVSFFFHRNYQPYPWRINSPLHRPPTKKNCKPTPLSSSSLPHHPYRSPVKASTPFSFKSRDNLPSYSD